MLGVEQQPEELVVGVDRGHALVHDLDLAVNVPAKKGIGDERVRQSISSSGSGGGSKPPGERAQERYDRSTL